MTLTGTSNENDTSSPSKQAACLQCRRSKIKCSRDDNSTVCKKCQSSGAECVVPDYHVGRYKGVKNKRTGLEKAIYQVEQALKRSKNNPVSSEEPDVDLRQLINSVQPSASAKDTQTSNETTASIDDPMTVRQLPDTHVTHEIVGADGVLPVAESGLSAVPEQPEKANEIALDNADNPLQLLAMASVLPTQSPSTIISPSPAFASQSSPQAVEREDEELQRFFGNLLPNLDSSRNCDPIELGFITNEEADPLAKYFYEHLSHTRWGLDPVLHTPAFIRSRSAFLFTSILAASATFLPDTSALAKRLSNHRDHLAQGILLRRHRSIEIVLAFMINIPWLSPAKHWADDATCIFLSMALTVALDLQLNKIVIPSSTIRPAGFLDRVAKSDCIDATKALQLDGFPHVSPSSIWGRRLLRTRERVWLSLFVLDRGICLARGRPYAVPTGPLVDSCDSWHISDIADKWDGAIISTAVLRRDLVGLISSIRDACDSHQLAANSGFSTVKYLKDKMDRFFDQWYTIWSLQISQSDGQLPPYVEILVSHTKLSTYCSVINHPTASSDVKQFFRAAGLTSAMNVMRAAVNGEARLKSMPNNTVIMVSFAACFALGLSTTHIADQPFLSPRVRSLIEQTTETLQRIGTLPKHRNGTSALFGRHIRRIMKSSIPETEREPWSIPDISQDPDHGPDVLPTTTRVPPTESVNTALASNEPYAFNMTDDEIMEAINNASATEELFQLDENMFLDWLEWPHPS